MRNNNSSRQTLIPAVGCVRRSTDMQEASLPEQKREVERYSASNGFKITRWVEETIGGAKSQRPKFDQLLDDCDNPRRDFEAIVWWNWKRFSRKDSISVSPILERIRQSGVGFHTTDIGAIDLATSTGRMLAFMHAETADADNSSKSRDVTRSKINNAVDGYSNGRRACYAYDRVLVDEQGVERRRMKNGEEIDRPKTWKVSFTISDDPERANAVREIMRQYADGVGCGRIADALNRSGVPAPNGGEWR